MQGRRSRRRDNRKGEVTRRRQQDQMKTAGLETRRDTVRPKQLLSKIFFKINNKTEPSRGPLPVTRLPRQARNTARAGHSDAGAQMARQRALLGRQARICSPLPDLPAASAPGVVHDPSPGSTMAPPQETAGAFFAPSHDEEAVPGALRLMRRACIAAPATSDESHRCPALPARLPFTIRRQSHPGGARADSANRSHGGSFRLPALHR